MNEQEVEEKSSVSSNKKLKMIMKDFYNVEIATSRGR